MRERKERMDLVNAHVKLPRSLDNAVRKRAEDEDRTYTSVVRRALWDYVSFGFQTHVARDAQTEKAK